MSLARFARADGVPGHLYELEHGVVVVMNVPNLPHARVVSHIRHALLSYAERSPGQVDLVAGGMDSVLRLWEAASERHPDVTVYLSAPPSDDPQPWDEWTPEIVIEVVSHESRVRDYSIKPAGYLAAGVREYWIIDPLRASATVHRRRGDRWKTQRYARTGTIRTALLPGFVLRVTQLLAAARGARQ
jgi:Uma2 family endonuclease